MLGDPPRRAGLHRRDHGAGGRRHDPTGRLQRRSLDRRNAAPNVHPDRRRLHAERHPRGSPPSTGNAHRVRSAAARRHRDRRSNRHRAAHAGAGGVDSGSGGGDRLWHPAARGDHRIGLDDRRRRGERRGDLQCQSDGAGPCRRRRHHAEQRRARRRGADPHPRRDVDQRHQRSAVRHRRRPRRCRAARSTCSIPPTSARSRF